MGMTFYLGTANPSWFDFLDAPLFLSRRVGSKPGKAGWLLTQKNLPRARYPWALDSGGFKELEAHGAWLLPPKVYVKEVRRAAEEIGNLRWAAVQDWMCEPSILHGGPTAPGITAPGTGLSIREHQIRTIESYCTLRELGGEGMAHLWAPVLQGWCVEDYWEHVNMYLGLGKVDLSRVPAVGVGSICRRQGMDMAKTLFRVLTESFPFLEGKLHAFGVKNQGLRGYARIGLADDPSLYTGIYRKHLSKGIPLSPIQEAVLASARRVLPTTWEEVEDPTICEILGSSDSFAWAYRARWHAEDVRACRDAWLGTGWGEKPLRGGGIGLYVGGTVKESPGGWRYYAGGRKVAEVDERLAGVAHACSPTQMTSFCAEDRVPPTQGHRGCGHQACTNCACWAVQWREELLLQLPDGCGTAWPPVHLDAPDPTCAEAWRRKWGEAVDDPSSWLHERFVSHEQAWRSFGIPEQGLNWFPRYLVPFGMPSEDPTAIFCPAIGTGPWRYGQVRETAPAIVDEPWEPSPWKPETKAKIARGKGKAG